MKGNKLEKIKTKYQYKTTISSAEELKNFEDNHELCQKFKHINTNLSSKFTVSASKHLPFFWRSYFHILKGLSENKNFLIIPDYDPDGINSWFLYYHLLTLLKTIYKSKSKILIKPTARDEWYGLSEKFFNSDIHYQTDYIITTDIWIAVKFPSTFIWGKEKIIIFDHHLPFTNIWFSIKEFHDYFLAMYPNFDVHKKSFTPSEKKDFDKAFETFKENKPALCNKFATTFISNNFVINYFKDYYYKYDDLLETLRDKENKDFQDLWKEPIETKFKNEIMEKDKAKIFYSSAWELATAICESVILNLIEAKILNEKAKKLINFYYVPWSITSISDVTDLTSVNNLYFFLIWWVIVRNLQNNLSQELKKLAYSRKIEITKISDEEKFNVLKDIIKSKIGIKENLSELLWDEFVPDITPQQKSEFDKALWQIVNYFSYILWFNSSMSYTDLGFLICPSMNAYWRVSVTHGLFLRLLTWEIPYTANWISFNEVRKKLQQDIEELVVDDIERKQSYKNPICIWGYYHSNLDEDKIHHSYDALKGFYTKTYPDIFLDYSKVKAKKEDVIEHEKILLESSEWVVWIVASKIVEMFNKPAVVWKYSSSDENSIKGSGRSFFSLFDLWVSSFKSVGNVWWHDAAFGIQIKDIELFNKEITEAINNLTLSKIQKLYTIQIPLYINLKDNLKDILAFQKFFKDYDNIINANFSFSNFKDFELKPHGVTFMGKGGKSIKIVLQKWDKKITFISWNWKALFNKLEVPYLNFEVDKENKTSTWWDKFLLVWEQTDILEQLQYKLISTDLSVSSITDSFGYQGNQETYNYDFSFNI